MVVPHSTAVDSVTVWVASVLEPPAGLELRVGADVAIALDDDGWTVWRTHGNPVMWCRRVQVGELMPGTRYPVRLVGEGVEKATAIATTLPDALPQIGATPFVCLVGSCFAHFGDDSGTAGAAYRNLPGGSRPSVKFLTGDQVYLDAPFPRFLYNQVRRGRPPGRASGHLSGDLDAGRRWQGLRRAAARRSDVLHLGRP